MHSTNTPRVSRHSKSASLSSKASSSALWQGTNETRRNIKASSKTSRIKTPRSKLNLRRLLRRRAFPQPRFAHKTKSSKSKFNHFLKRSRTSSALMRNKTQAFLVFLEAAAPPRARSPRQTHASQTSKPRSMSFAPTPHARKPRSRSNSHTSPSNATPYEWKNRRNRRFFQPSLAWALKLATCTITTFIYSIQLFHLRARTPVCSARARHVII
mmetsp:Transcript_6693/g.22439  ORF Transcript_6693/g.22439 Transcript_6693/m.22439 type:complete len:213 (+) Transcript_6693:319-957(+)